MDKSEILKRAQSDRCDEFESHVVLMSNRIGTVTLIVICALAAIVEVIRGNGIYQYFSIISGFECAAISYQFANLKRKPLLFATILSGLSFIIFTVLYILYN